MKHNCVRVFDEDADGELDAVEGEEGEDEEEGAEDDDTTESSEVTAAPPAATVAAVSDDSSSQVKNLSGILHNCPAGKEIIVSIRPCEKVTCNFLRERLVISSKRSLCFRMMAVNRLKSSIVSSSSVLSNLWSQTNKGKLSFSCLQSSLLQLTH